MSKRKKCGWCGRGPVSCQEHGCISARSKADLLRWIEQHGLRWRAMLREHWMNGGEELRPIRNAIGPRGIATINPTEQQRQEFLATASYDDLNRAKGAV